MPIPSSHTRKKPGVSLRHDARTLAAQVLQRLEGAQAPVQAVLNSVLTRSACKRTDIALCVELCYGVLRMEIRLRWLLSRFLKATHKLPQHMHNILLIAAYGLVFLEAVPDYALVDWATESVKRAHGRTLAGVANACLRSVCREGSAPRDYAYYYVAGQDEQSQQALYHSLPLWIVRLWHHVYGPEKAAWLCIKSSARPAAGFRINRQRAGWEAVAQQLQAAGAEGLTAACFIVAPELRSQVEEQCALTAMLEEGRLSRQGAASQFALHALHVETWPEPIWDACAGQGTKCCALLELGKEVRLATDTHLPRLARIHSECRRLGLQQPLTVLASAQQPPLGFRPKTIVLDVPCSSLGVLAARPDIRRQRKEAQLQNFVQTQVAMLEAAYRELPSCGHIAYITCTQHPAENEEQIRAFLARHPKFTLAYEWNSPAENLLLEGMYAALLVKS